MKVETPDKKEEQSDYLWSTQESSIVEMFYIMPIFLIDFFYPF